MSERIRRITRGIAGHKRTAQRDAILRVLLKSGKSLTAKEVWERARKQHPSLGQDTVYRNLLLLVDKGDVAQTHLQNRSVSRFEASNSQRHHHHAICLGCGKGYCLRPGKEPRFPGVEADPLFRVTGHILEFHGWCGACDGRSRGQKLR